MQSSETEQEEECDVEEDIVNEMEDLRIEKEPQLNTLLRPSVNSNWNYDTETKNLKNMKNHIDGLLKGLQREAKGITDTKPSNQTA